MNTIQISVELLNELIKYIENTELTIDGEWGSCRSVEELIAQNEMPEIYNELKTLINTL